MSNLLSSRVVNDMDFASMLSEAINFAKKPEWKISIWAAVKRKLNGIQAECWHKAIFAAAMLAEIAGEKVPDENRNFFHSPEIKLFLIPGSTESECDPWKKGKSCAAAVFPIVISGKNEPSVALVFRFKDDETPYFICGRTDISGASYELASAICKAALNWSTEEKTRLFSQWIISGQVSPEDKIIPVDQIKQKLELAQKHRLYQRAKWLFPSDNQLEVRPYYDDIRIYTASSLWSALNIISELGNVHQGKLKFDFQFKNFHALIGGSTAAALYPALLCQKLEAVVLWHTKESQTKASTVENILRERFPAIKIDQYLIDNNNLEDMEKSFRNFFGGKDFDYRKQLLFNITSGTRLMSYAIVSLARWYPEIRMFYRTLDSDSPLGGDFFDFSQTPVLQTAIMPQTPPLNIDWATLAKRNSEINSLSDILKKT